MVMHSIRHGIVGAILFYQFLYQIYRKRLLISAFFIMHILRWYMWYMHKKAWAYKQVHFLKIKGFYSRVLTWPELQPKNLCHLNVI